MTRPEAAPVVTVKILEERQQVAPMWISLKYVAVAVDGPTTLAGPHKDARQPATQLDAHFL
jgi:hypothetical protein